MLSWTNQAALPRALTHAENEFKKGTDKYSSHIAFQGSIAFIQSLSAQLSAFSQSLNKCTFMFEEVVKERVQSTQAEYGHIFHKDFDSLSNIKRLLDEARATTKQKRDDFFVACEDLMDAKSKKNSQNDPQARKALTKARKANKTALENSYRDAYVF